MESVAPYFASAMMATALTKASTAISPSAAPEVRSAKSDESISRLVLPSTNLHSLQNTFHAAWSSARLCGSAPARPPAYATKTSSSIFTEFVFMVAVPGVSAPEPRATAGPRGRGLAAIPVETRRLGGRSSSEDDEDCRVAP